MCWQKINKKGTLITICNYEYGSDHCRETVVFHGQEVEYGDN